MTDTTAATVADRIAAIEKRLSVLEKQLNIPKKVIPWWEVAYPLAYRKEKQNG